MAAQTVKAFIQDAYQLVSASSPTVPLHGDDMSKGLQFLNELLNAYSATGLMTTIAQEIIYDIGIGQQTVTFGAPDYIPTPNITTGRLANLQNAWLVLDDVSYPLIQENRNVFYNSYKFVPQLGLPRFVIVVNQTDLTTVTFYPAPSQVYEVHFYGKFQLTNLDINGTMALLPTYYIRYLKLALSKDLCIYKGRFQAWNQLLEDQLIQAYQDMMSVSSVNLNIETEQESYLNGAWRVRAGV